MRAIPFVFVAALVAPAAADPVVVPAAARTQQPKVVVMAEPPAKREAKEAGRDLVSALRDFRGHLAAWSVDPYRVSSGMLLGHDTITILQLSFK